MKEVYSIHFYFSYHLKCRLYWYIAKVSNLLRFFLKDRIKRIRISSVIRKSWNIVRMLQMYLRSSRCFWKRKFRNFEIECQLACKILFTNSSFFGFSNWNCIHLSSYETFLNRSVENSVYEHVWIGPVSIVPGLEMTEISF